MVNFQSDAMSMIHFSTAMQYLLFLEKLNIAIVSIIYLDHRERLFSIILLILGPIILGLFTDWLGSSESKLY